MKRFPQPDIEIYRIIDVDTNTVVFASLEQDEITERARELTGNRNIRVDALAFYTKPKRQLTHYTSSPYQA